MIYAPREDPAALAAAVARLRDRGLRSRLRAGGLETAGRFSERAFNEGVAARIETAVRNRGRMEAIEGEGPSVRVVVVSWNTRELLRACLESLAADVDSGLCEVVVVDNDSGDGSAAMVAADFPWVKLIEAGANLGFGAGGQPRRAGGG